MFASVLALGVLTAAYGSAAAVPASLQGLTWSALSPPQSPPGLVGAVSAYDSTNSTIVVFGGQLADGQLSAQTWVWDGSTWSKAAAFGASPAPRELASMAFDTALDPPQLILFGGRGDDGALLDDTWAWNGSSWNQLATTSAPGGREGAAMTADAAGQVVLFGGYGQTTPAASTTTTTTTTTTPTTRPSPSTSTTTTTVPPAATTTTSPTTTAPSTTTTTVPATTTTTTVTSATSGPTAPVTSVPAGAAGAGGPADPDLTATVAAPQVLDDTWVLSRSDAWVQVAAAVHPPPTTDASMATGPSGQTMLFGGSGRAPGDGQTAGTTRQTWLYLGGTWSKVKMAAAPSARQDAAVAYDAALGVTVLFGGVGPAGPLADTWVWNGATWQRVTPASAPSARSGGTAAYDAASQHLVAFGGTNATGGALSSTEVLGAYAPIVASGSTTTSSGPSSTASSTSGQATTTTIGDSSAFGSGSVATTTAPTTASVVPAPKRYSVHRGDVMTLSGSGFMPDARITITFHSVAQLVGLAVANADGDFTKNVEVPEGAAAGDHHFEASGPAPSGRMTEEATPVEVVGVPGAGHTSTRTKLILLGIALAIPVLSWAGLDLAARRRVTPRR